MSQLASRRSDDQSRDSGNNAVSGGDWFAYQSHDMSSRTLGDLQFLQYGPGRTYSEPPARMPNTQRGLGWRYLLVGRVNLESGVIIPQEAL